VGLSGYDVHLELSWVLGAECTEALCCSIGDLRLRRGRRSVVDGSGSVVVVVVGVGEVSWGSCLGVADSVEGVGGAGSDAQEGVAHCEEQSSSRWCGRASMALIRTGCRTALVW
jgi:hypothetical protein